MQVEKVNLTEKFTRFSAHWSPQVVGALNGQEVRLVKILGAFDSHDHAAEDELFLVVKERFRMELRDRDVEVEAGEFIIIPRGVEHRPVADEGGADPAVRARVHRKHRERPHRAHARRAPPRLGARSSAEPKSARAKSEVDCGMGSPTGWRFRPSSRRASSSPSRSRSSQARSAARSS